MFTSLSSPTESILIKTSTNILSFVGFTRSALSISWSRIRFDKKLPVAIECSDGNKSIGFPNFLLSKSCGIKTGKFPVSAKIEIDMIISSRNKCIDVLKFELNMVLRLCT